MISLQSSQASLLHIAILFLLISTGCSSTVAMKQSHNEFNQFIYQSAIDSAERQMLSEKNGGKPTGGFDSWEAYWSNRIRSLKKIGDSNSKRILAYIETRRNELRLPSYNIAEQSGHEGK